MAPAQRSISSASSLAPRLQCELLSAPPGGARLKIRGGQGGPGTDIQGVQCNCPAVYGPPNTICRFEREAQLGGRAQEVQYGGLTLELGASIVWHNNYLLTGLAAAAGLQRERPGPGKQGDSLFAIYDGRELVFEESPWRLLTLFRLLWRYWLSWFMVRSAPAATFAKFEGAPCDFAL